MRDSLFREFVRRNIFLLGSKIIKRYQINFSVRERPNQVKVERNISFKSISIVMFEKQRTKKDEWKKERRETK